MGFQVYLSRSLGRPAARWKLVVDMGTIGAAYRPASGRRLGQRPIAPGAAVPPIKARAPLPPTGGHATGISSLKSWIAGNPVTLRAG
jgi:hypothetical protein